MALRELLLLAVITVICLVAIVRPKIGVYGYIWFAVMRPDLLAWCPDKYNLSAFLAIATTIGTIPYLPRLTAIFQNPISRWLVLLQIPLALSTILAVNPLLSYDRYIDFLKSLLILLLVPVYVRTLDELKQLLLLIAISVGVIGVKFGLFGVLEGGTILVNGYGGQMSDNNLVALAFAIIAPLCWYGLGFTESKLVKLSIAFILPLTMAGIVMSNSRGSSLAVGVVILMVLRRAKNKVTTLAIALLVVGGAVYMVRDQYITRMATIATYKEESSAASRLEFGKAAIAMWADHPIIGVGFGGLNYIALTPLYLGRQDGHVVHNTYLQTLVDSGIFALLIYIRLLFGTIMSLGRSAQHVKKRMRGEEYIPLAIQAGLLAFAVGGTFYSSQRYDLPYILLMAAASWQMIQRDEAVAEAQGQTVESDYTVADGALKPA